MKEYFDYLLVRKSVRRFDGTVLSDSEYKAISGKLAGLIPLFPDIEVAYKIVKTEETNCKWNGEYCLLAYSEKKTGYLENIGYLLEQWDLFLASMSVGACWYGWGKTAEKEYEGKSFVIMINFGKSRKEDFRADVSTTKRKSVSTIWQGDTALNVANVVRYAPSACNSQPWQVTCEDNKLTVYHAKGISSVVATKLSVYFNRMDVGIFLCFMESALEHFGYSFSRSLLITDSTQRPTPVAEYLLN